MTRTKDLENQVAIVTGAASGIGQASAYRLAEMGARVVLFDIQKTSLQQVQKEIENNGGKAISIEVDVANDQDMKDGFRQVIDQWGRLDIVFANAGINGKVTPIENLSAEDWDETLNTNLKGTFLTIHHAIPYMKEEGGSMIITSSINGNRTFSNIGMSAYSTSKAGQMAFGKMAALELTQYNIRVNIICPGAIATSIEDNTFKEKIRLQKVDIPVVFPEGGQPLEHGPGTPEQVADLVYFLASPASRHITGSEIYIDGAESLLR